MEHSLVATVLASTTQWALWRAGSQKPSSPPGSSALVTGQTPVTQCIVVPQRALCSLLARAFAAQNADLLALDLDKLLQSLRA